MTDATLKSVETLPALVVGPDALWDIPERVHHLVIVIYVVQTVCRRWPACVAVGAYMSRRVRQ